MREQRFAILEHTRRGDRHFDVLIEPPATMRRQTGGTSPEPRLWAARLAGPWPFSPGRRAVTLTALPPHRWRYLDYEGSVSGGRGAVRCVGRGLARPRLWVPFRLDVELSGRRGGRQWALRLMVERRGQRWWGGLESGGGASPIKKRTEEPLDAAESPGKVNTGSF